MQYSEFQNMPSSEKITLAFLQASKRLMGWELHSGSIYKITNFTHPVVVAVEDSGTGYTSVGSVGALVASSYYLDRTNHVLYVHATGSANPNSRIIVVTVKFFYANVPVVLPHDLDEGFDVFFEPLVASTSEFGVEIDTIAQSSEAIEGSGSLTLCNDLEFWPANFDKLSFENQRCSLYSYNRNLEPSDAALIFKGRVERKTYAKDKITFQLKDQLAELRAPVSLETIGSLELRSGDDLANAKQRMILGRVFGNVPTNVDQVLDGYPLTGTISISFGTTSVTGLGTAFLSELSPNDEIVLDGETYAIASISSNTALELSQEYEGDTALSGASVTFVPEEPKRFINRVFKVAGHALREPVTLTEGGSNIQTLYVNDTTDIYPGDDLYVGELGFGEVVKADIVSGTNYIRLATSLATVPPVGTSVRRPAIQNVRIDDVALVYYRDYTFDASTAVLTLNETAEANAGPVFQMNSSVTFTNTSRAVTGTGFQGVIKPGNMIGLVENAVFFEVLSVDSDTAITLRTPATFTDTDTGRYKPFVYSHGDTVLSLDVLGRTDDGTTSGVLLKTAPSITRALIEDAGLSDDVDEDSFDAAEEIAYQHIGIVVPVTFDDSKAPTYREVLNDVNKSVFGSLIQNSLFQLGYEVLQPQKPTAATKFSESDILSFSLTSVADNAVKTVFLEYLPKEHDYVSGDRLVTTIESSSDNATYILRTERTKTITTNLVSATDADIISKRWSFLLSSATGRLQFTTKLQGSTLQIGDIIEIEHRKFYQRYGGTSGRKLLLVESVKRNGLTVHIEATDFSNTFNRVASINELSNEYGDATESEKLYGGYISDQYGLIDNDAESFETNLIW